jgi:hypothetical protein
MENEMEDKGDDTPWTMPIPEFGKRYYGLGRSAAYAAASRGRSRAFRPACGAAVCQRRQVVTSRS